MTHPDIAHGLLLVIIVHVVVLTVFALRSRSYGGRRLHRHPWGHRVAARQVLAPDVRTAAVKSHLPGVHPTGKGTREE